MMKKAWFIFLCLLLCGPIALALAQVDNEREVVATGLGMTEDEAKKQAYRAAVQNVVGAMVVGETLVQNDDLVEEKILSYSDGYVTKAEQIGATKALEGGLMSVTMNVTVRGEADCMAVFLRPQKGLFGPAEWTTGPKPQVFSLFSKSAILK